MRLEGKVALVTGAGAGIGGRGELFAREGASVAVVDLNAQTAQQTADNTTKRVAKRL